MSSGRQSLLTSQTAQSSSTSGQSWSSRVTDRLIRIVETATNTLDPGISPTTRGATDDPQRSSSGLLAASQPAIPGLVTARSAGNALDQTDDQEGQGPLPEATPPETAAAAAERHRLNDGSIVDIPALVAWIECNLLFTLVLLNLFITLHCTGVAIFAAMTLIIALMNRFLRHQIGLKEARKRFLLAAAAMYTVGHAATFASPSRLALTWDKMSLLPSKQLGSAYTSVWQCFGDAILVDGMLRFATVAAKLVTVLFSKASPEDRFQHRARLLNAEEHVSVCLRILATTPFWFHYFQTCTEYTFFLYTGVYLCLKVRLMCEKGKQAFKAVKSCFHSCGSPYGVHIAVDALLEEGQRASCPICQETMTAPLQLSCKHVFCTACISEWLEREPSCPMCRSQIQSPNMAYKDGAVSLLPQLF